MNMDTPQVPSEESQFVRPQQAPLQIQPAGFWVRFAALFIDGIVINIITVPINLAISALTGGVLASGALRGNAAPIAIYLVSYLITFIIMWTYYGYFYSKKGASPGKMVLNLGVIDSDNGTLLTFHKAGAREVFGKFFLVVFTLGISYIVALFTKDKRALHDIVFHTQVIRRVLKQE